MGYQNVLIDEYEYTTLSLSQILARQNFGPWQLHVWNPQFSSGSHNSLTGLNWLAPWMVFFFFCFSLRVQRKQSLETTSACIFSPYLRFPSLPRKSKTSADIYIKSGALSQNAWNGISKQSSRIPLLMLVWPTFLMSLSYTTDRRIRDQRHTYLWHSPRGP